MGKVASDGTPFYNHYAERIVIAAISKDIEDAIRYTAQLSSDDFHDLNCRALFSAYQKAISECRHEGKTIDDGTLVEYIANGIGDTLMAVRFEIMRAHGVEAWAAKKHVYTLQTLKMRRDMYRIMRDAAKMLEDEEQETEAALEQTRQQLRDLVITGHTWHSMQNVLVASYEAIERRARGEDKPVTTGIVSLDRLTTGFQRGELTVIGARPAVGKSALAMFMTLAAAKQNHRVGLCSLEMTPEQYGMRILSAGANVDNYNMRTGKLEDGDWEQLQASMQRHFDLNVSFVFTARMVEDLRMEVQNAVDTRGMDLLVIDYLQLLRSRNRFDKDNERIGYVSRMLKNMTIDFNLPIIALAQVGRSANNDMPTLSELRGSGEIEQDADNVIFMHRPFDVSDKFVDPDDRHLFELLKQQGKQYIVLDVAKQRQGQTGTTAVVFDPAHMQYTSIVPECEEETYVRYQ